MILLVVYLLILYLCDFHYYAHKYSFYFCFLHILILFIVCFFVVFFFKQKTAYELRISDWSSDVCSSDLLAHGHFRVRWPLPEPAPKVSLVIPTRDCFELLHTCVESLLGSTDYPNVELVVVDNQSSEPQALAYLAELGSRERVRVLRYDAPFNYSAINNWAIGQCDGELVRSEEHTSELQSLMRISYAVFCLKKKMKAINKSKQIQENIN